MKYTTKSADETRRLGERIGHKLKAGQVVALIGDLGAGKTTLVKGIAKGLGVKNEDKVSSPTFVLIHEYEGRVKIFHIDWYRLDGVKGLDEYSFEECFTQDAVTLVEWADRAINLLPKKSVVIELKHKNENAREISIEHLGI